MSAPLEVPTLADLEGMPIEIIAAETPWIVSVRAWAGDGDHVIFTWDEVAGSVNIRWMGEGRPRLILEREAASKVSVREESGGVEFSIWFRGEDLAGRLVVRAGEHVSISDALLRG